MCASAAHAFEAIWLPPPLPKLLEHLEQCMAFYQLQPYLRGGIPCELSEISVDEMVVFLEKNMRFKR